MQLEILNSPTVKPRAHQMLTAKYIPEKEYTCINCDVDIITLGLTIRTLTGKFNEALAKLNDEKLANEICLRIEKAVQDNETNRSSSDKPTRNK